jgi:phosphatidylglycerophosphatase A
MRNTPINWIKKTASSLLFIGYFPIASGTVGSAAAAGLVWLIHIKAPHLLSTSLYNYHLIIIAAVVLIAIIVSSGAKEMFGAEDPRQVVIDEFAGQLITFFMIPLTWRTLLLGFLLFRFFDIIKPFPVHKMEELEGGVGITMDDVAAGVYANISLFVLMAGYQWVRGLLNS